MLFVDIDFFNILFYEFLIIMFYFKIFFRKIEVDIERYILFWSDVDICLFFIYVKYEEVEGVNSNWFNLFLVFCNVISFMLILKKKKKI